MSETGSTSGCSEASSSIADNEEDLNMSRDAKIVQPCVINKYREFWYRYVVDVLTDAQVYSDHASKSAIDIDDVKLAIQSQANLALPKIVQGRLSTTPPSG